MSFRTESFSRRRHHFIVVPLEALDARALLSDGLAPTPVADPPQPPPAAMPAPAPTVYPVAKPYNPTTDDGTGQRGYNPGKVIIPANFPRDQILIKPEKGDGLQQVPPGNVTVPADGVYLRPGPGISPGVVKVPDGHTIIVTYNPNGSWNWQEGPEQSGVLALLVDPKMIFPDESGWPANPLPPDTTQPPMRQR